MTGGIETRIGQGQVCLSLPAAQRPIFDAAAGGLREERTTMPRGIILPPVVMLLAAASLLTLLGVLPLADRLTGGAVAALAPALPYVLVCGSLLVFVVSAAVPSPHDQKRAERHRTRQAQRQLAARLALSPRELEALLHLGRPVDERARRLLQARMENMTLARGAPASDERRRTAHATRWVRRDLRAADQARAQRALEAAPATSRRSGARPVLPAGFVREFADLDQIGA
jgi:hypothetical protein